MKKDEHDEVTARALITRQLWLLPPLLTGCVIEDVVRALETCTRAQHVREALVLRTLRRVLSCAVADNEATIPRVASGLHSLARTLPAGSLAGDGAAALLLLFAHGLGQAASLSQPPPSETASAPLVVMLGFAGGTPNDLDKYARRCYSATADEVLQVCASEIPEVFERNVDQVMDAVKGRQWVVHLFSKAGFLMLARLAARLQKGCSSEALPAAVIWDSSPGSISNYEEFVSGTWSSAERLSAHFLYSDATRARMDALLRSNDYALSVRESYAPMLGIAPFPFPGRCHHLFLYSDQDPVCSPEEIQRYAAEVAAANGSAADGGRSCVSVRVRGTHCDGLFWSSSEYTSAVKELLARCVGGDHTTR
jgi:hypothetical protein